MASGTFSRLPVLVARAAGYDPPIRNRILLSPGVTQLRRGLSFGRRAGMRYFPVHGVRYSPVPTRGSGSSSRTWNTPPMVSAFARYGTDHATVRYTALMNLAVGDGTRAKRSRITPAAFHWICGCSGDPTEIARRMGKVERRDAQESPSVSSSAVAGRACENDE